MTGGVFAIVAGAAMIGAGSSLMLSPFKKKLTGECITNKDIRQEIVFGGVIGALAMPIGLAGTVATKSVTDAVRLRIRNRKSIARSDESIECTEYRPMSEMEIERGPSEENCVTQLCRF